MTIKELCRYPKACKQCIYSNACPFLYAHWERPLYSINENDNEMITKAIIETARILKDNERLTNREWIDFLSQQFNVSRRCAKNMLHGMMTMKRIDNSNKQFN